MELVRVKTFLIITIAVTGGAITMTTTTVRTLRGGKQLTDISA
jgi:hypothetical protein